MGSLEKLFLGSMVLFGGFILFMFSLYFDLGDFFTGSIHRRNQAVSMSTMEDRVDQARRNATREEIMPKSATVPISPGQNLPVEQLTKMYVVAARKLTADELVEQERKRLTRLGFKSEPYVRMHLLKIRDEPLRALRSRLEAFEVSANWDEALAMVLAAIDETDPANLIVLHELYVHLREVQMVRQDLAAAEEATAKAFELMKAIKSIEANEPKFREDEKKSRKIQEETAEMEKEYGQARKVFGEMKTHVASGRDLRRFSAAEVAKAKLDIMQSFERGEIDSEERDDALSALEEIVRKGL